jgi:hypothetical protein
MKEDKETKLLLSISPSSVYFSRNYNFTKSHFFLKTVSENVKI